MGVTISRSIRIFGRTARRSSGWRISIRAPFSSRWRRRPSETPARSACLHPAFARRAVDGEYWLVDDGHNRSPAVLIGSANPNLPAAVVIPLDADFATRADAALRLWRLIIGRPRGRPPDRLTRQRRHRLGLALRALDGRLDGASYRVITAGF